MLIDKEKTELSSWYYECIERARDAWMHSYNLAKEMRTQVRADKAVFEYNANEAIREASVVYVTIRKSIMQVAADFDGLPGFSGRNLYRYLDDENNRRLIQNKSVTDLEPVTPFFQKNVRLIEGDFFEESKQIADTPIALIFTDPPYDFESLYLYEQLAIVAARVLKPGGSLITYSGGYYKPQVFEHILRGGNGDLRYWWDIAVKHTGMIPFSDDRRVFIRWKSLLWFVKGKTLDPAFPINSLNDFIESKQPDKSAHEWAQSPIEAEYIISNLSLENDSVLDPMMGYATTGIAALSLGRKFIGIENNPVHYANATERLTQYVSLLETGE